MRQYGLIGRTLGHSFSKLFFEQKFEKENRFDCCYDLFELPTLDDFSDFLLKNPDLQGFNVTIPYKRSIIPLMDDLDVEAAQVGAVNTVRVFREDQNVRLVGFNTDIEGFRQSLAGKPLPERALILGTGGASAAVKHVLQQLNVTCQMVSRSPQKDMLSYAQVDPECLKKHLWIVNCTPVGMFPNVNDKPVLPYECLTERHFLFDLVYNPEETCFLKEGRMRGAQVQNGLPMLYAQAEAAWKIWNSPTRTIY